MASPISPPQNMSEQTVLAVSVHAIWTAVMPRNGRAPLPRRPICLRWYFTMVDGMQNAAMLWSGGKDSAMALYEADQSGCAVSCLVTFAPPKAKFLAHPLAIIEMQARALALPHFVLTINSPFKESYEAGLRRLKDEWGVGCVVTGDIAEVDGYSNWIRERSHSVGMKVHAPLWGRDRNTLLRQLVDRGFDARISCINKRWLDETWVGRQLNDAAIADLRTVREVSCLDLCGEEGEYHTLILDGPQFRQSIEIRSYQKRATDSLMYMDITDLELVDHARECAAADRRAAAHSRASRSQSVL